MALSLYIHIPFCLKRCVYCDFVSGIYDPAKEAAYITALKKEISNMADKGPFSTLYIGGGTPTSLSIDTLSGLIDHIFEHLSFDRDYEATIEANPGTVNRGKLQAIRSAGINRISIGIQSFNDDELKVLGRIHSAGDAEKAVKIVRDTGFENISIDLIYGIPGQDIRSWRKTLQKTADHEPEHISTYELTVEKDTQLREYIKKGKLNPLGEEKIIEMYECAIDHLNAKGFEHYEISNFAKSGYSCRHNLNYWDRGEYFGAGLGAHSFINKKRFYNIDILDNYIKAVSENKSPIKGEEDITEDKALSEEIFLGLRKTGGIDLKTISETYEKDILKLYQNEIKQLQGAGLIKFNNKDHIALTIKGLLLSNEVFAKFM